MKERCRENRSGTRLICAGAIVFMVGLMIILFKEFNFPRYWVPAGVGVALMLGGVVVHGMRRLCGRQENQSKSE